MFSVSCVDHKHYIKYHTRTTCAVIMVNLSKNLFVHHFQGKTFSYAKISNVVLFYFRLVWYSSRNSLKKAVNEHEIECMTTSDIFTNFHNKCSIEYTTKMYLLADELNNNTQCA